MSLSEAVVCITIIFAWYNLEMVRADVTAVTDVLLPIELCHKAIHLYGPNPDDDITTVVRNSLLALDQPFEIHTRHYLRQFRVDDLTSAIRFTCLANLVLVQDGPLMRKIGMNLLLKRFYRVRGHENDFVLVFALRKDGISKWDNWGAGRIKSVMPRNFPDNAMLLELEEFVQPEDPLRSYYVSDIYIFQLYCDEEQEVCWKLRSIGFFPEHKSDFDAAFSRERAEWRYNYNSWPLLLHVDLLENIDAVATMNFRQATCGRYTWDDYTSVEKHIYTFNAPTIWLALEIANHMNATLEPKPLGMSFEQSTEIRAWQMLRAHLIVTTLPYTRNVYLKFGYYTFGYCTNGTVGRENTNMFAFFTPLDFISWIIMGFVMLAIATLSWCAGKGFQLFELAACLASPSSSLAWNGRLAALVMLWYVVAFVVFNYYSAFIESVLAVPHLESRIQDFKTLNASCDVPWIHTKAQADLTERFRDVEHMKALIDRSNLTSTLTEPDFFRHLVEHEKQCVIHQSDRDSGFWAEAGAKFQPDATFSEGKEKLIGDPVMWHISPPNAALMYRTVRALEATGVLLKFGEYFENRKKERLDHFVTDRLEIQRRKYNSTENLKKEQSGSECLDCFTMANIKMVFKSYLILSGCAFCVFLVELVQLFAELSWYSE